MVLIFLMVIGFSSQIYSAQGEPKPIFSFGLMADIHYNSHLPHTHVRYFQYSYKNVIEAVEIMNEKDVNFLVSLGDTITESADRERTIPDLLTIDSALSSFKGDLHYVMGNHDLARLMRQDFLDNTSGVVSEPNYFFDMEGYRFIVLDANWQPRWSIHREVVQWLEEILIEANEKGFEAIVFVHQGLDNRVHDHVIQNAEDVRQIFNRVGNVFAVFQGHTHAGGYWNIDGVHYLGIQAMVNDPFATFAIATVYEDGIDIDGYGSARHAWLPK